MLSSLPHQYAFVKRRSQCTVWIEWHLAYGLGSRLLCLLKVIQVLPQLA